MTLIFPSHSPSLTKPFSEVLFHQILYTNSFISIVGFYNKALCPTSGKELKCCYRASTDGFSATDFHECCDFKGPCVIIGYTTNSFKFGAFNPEGYRSTDDFYDTFNAFLFYWKEDEEATTVPVILPKIGGSGAALFDHVRGGPQFGADGLLIGPALSPVMGVFTGPDANTGVGDLRQAQSRLGLSYAKREDGKISLFGDESRAALEDVQVFCSPKIASLYYDHSLQAYTRHSSMLKIKRTQQTCN